MAVKPFAVVDTRVIDCGDNLEQLKKLPPACVETIEINMQMAVRATPSAFKRLKGSRAEYRDYNQGIGKTQLQVSGNPSL